MLLSASPSTSCSQRWVKCNNFWKASISNVQIIPILPRAVTGLCATKGEGKSLGDLYSPVLVWFLKWESLMNWLSLYKKCRNVVECQNITMSASFPAPDFCWTKWRLCAIECWYVRDLDETGEVVVIFVCAGGLEIGILPQSLHRWANDVEEWVISNWNGKGG